MKYRLKKDTPEFKTGSMFTRRKYEYGDYDDDCLFADISPGVSPVPAFDVSLIDNFDEWFEEVKDEPKYLRRLIKELKFGKKDEVEIVFRFIKDWYYYYYDEVMSNSMFDGYDEGITERIMLKLGKKDDVFDVGITIKGLNQLVRDGYIEIQANPNIVWEDEKCD